MIQIAPSILSDDLSQIGSTVVALERAGADIIHLDVMDGQFVPPITFGAKLAADLRPLVEMPFEAHLMTETPEAHFEAFAKAGCKRIIFHAEATKHAHRLAQTLKEMGLEAGLAINPGTSEQAVLPILHLLDLVLVMTVNPGWGGQAFLAECLGKVAAIRQASDVLIEVDGGIAPDTIAQAHGAGANVFVVGSHLASSPDKGAAISELRSLCEP